MYNESYEKIKTEIQKQKIEKDVKLNGHNYEINYVPTNSKKQNNHKNGHKPKQTVNVGVSPVIDNNVTNSELEKPKFITSEKFSQPINEDIGNNYHINDPWEDDSSDSNTFNGNENSLGTSEAFMDIFNSVEKKMIETIINRKC